MAIEKLEIIQLLKLAIHVEVGFREFPFRVSAVCGKNTDSGRARR